MSTFTNAFEAKLRVQENELQLDLMRLRIDEQRHLRHITGIETLNDVGRSACPQAAERRELTAEQGQLNSSNDGKRG